MFSDLLDEVDNRYRDPKMPLTTERHEESVGNALAWLSADSEPLFGATKALLGENVFEGSEIGFEWHPAQTHEGGVIHPPVMLGSMFVRGTRTDRSLSLDLSIARAFSSPTWHQPASVAIELEFGALGAKEAFETIYKDYRAQVRRLLQGANIEFFTPYCSQIVGRTKSNKAPVQLDEYLSDPDVDNCFTLSKPCPRGTTHSQAMRAFTALSALYIACHTARSGKAWRRALEKNFHKFG